MAYLNRGNGYYLADGIAAAIVDLVPKGFYSVLYDEDSSQFYLSPTEPFTIDHKVYGKSDQWSTRILETFARRQGKPTAAAFVGEKGSGKSLLLKRISMDFADLLEGIVLLVEKPYHGPAFNSFLQSIQQSKIVVLDEFEKLYVEDKARNSMLTLLDGVWPQHTLFLITANTTLYNPRLDFFNNRPGRVYFNIEFKSVDLDVINEYLEDNLVDKSRTKEVLEFISRFLNFNIDMLSVLVTEMNTNPSDSVEELSQILNIKPQTSTETVDLKWEVEHIESGYKYNEDDLMLKDYEFIQWINKESPNCNPYTYLDEDDSKFPKEREFDIYLDHSNSTVTQDHTTRAITVISQGYKFIVTPMYKNFLQSSNRVAL